MDEAFMVYRFNTTYEPEISGVVLSGRKRLTVSCECLSRLYPLSSGQAKHCPSCGLVMARVGNVLTIAKV